MEKKKISQQPYWSTQHHRKFLMLLITYAAGVSENIDGDTDKLNSEFKYHYQDVHRAKMKITGFVPNKKVVWHVLDQLFQIYRR